MKRWSKPLCLAVPLVLFSSSSEAHLVNTRLGDFYGGMFHPLSGLDDMLPWLALAILAALQGARNGRWLFLIVPAGLAAGALLSVLVPGLTIAPLLNLCALAGAGLLAVLNLPLPVAAFAGLAALIAIASGYGNGLAMASDTNRMLFTAGVSAAGYAFIALATSLLIAFLDGRGGWRAIVLRAGGSWISALGIMVLGLKLIKPM